MSDKAQRRLLSLLVIAIFVALDRLLKKIVAEKVPERRRPSEDVTEAVLQGWRGWLRSSSLRPSCGSWPSGGAEAKTADHAKRAGAPTRTPALSPFVTVYW